VITRFETMTSPAVPTFSESGVRNALPVNEISVAEPCPPKFGVMTLRVGGDGITVIVNTLLVPFEVTATMLCGPKLTALSTEMVRLAVVPLTIVGVENPIPLSDWNCMPFIKSVPVTVMLVFVPALNVDGVIPVSVGALDVTVSG